ncbi:hypothetical protein PSHT_04932 [Puccinia striiformis]|uniref:OTU domain-containing protein n=1 Tax=Puccinia striiformis TaxID=27350 RepID=A0A2S4WBQ4_9BASI|nr:hypothetical protein PSHT_04932 [Puccinia striiformis]
MSTDLQNVPPELLDRMQAMILAMLQAQQPALISPTGTDTVDQSLPSLTTDTVVPFLATDPPDLYLATDTVDPLLPSPAALVHPQDHPPESIYPVEESDEENHDPEVLPVIHVSPERQPAPLIVGDHTEPPQLITDLDKFDYTNGAWAKARGYAVCKLNSSLGKNVYIRCDRSGDYCGLGTNPSGRQTALIKINCPFLVYGSTSTSEKVTNKSWRMQVRCVDHNHKASPSPASHAAHRVLIPAQIEEIQRLWKSNLRPAQILLQLQTSDPNILATNKTILNALQKIRHEDLAGRSPIKVMMTILKETNWASEVKAALRKALKTVYPDSQAHLCIWHLTKNITTHCKSHFTGPKVLDSSGELVHPWDQFLSLWKQVAYAKTADLYVEHHNNLEEYLKTKSPGVGYTPALDYIEKNILPVKELFVVAWSCQYPHLRNLDTSRVESGHAYLKTFIKNSTGNLLTVFNSLTLAVNAQIMSVHESIGKDTMKKLVNVPKAFIPLLGQILSLTIKECKPYYYWRNPPAASPNSSSNCKDFVAPNVKKNPKGRPSSKKAAAAAASKSTSTTRNPSAFEIVEAKTAEAQKIVDADLKKAQKAVEASKAAEASKMCVRPTKKRVTKASGAPARRKRMKKTNPSEEVQGNDKDDDGDEDSGDLPDLPELAIGQSPGKVERTDPVKEERRAPGQTKGEKEEHGSSYGEEVNSAALLALLDEKMAVPELTRQMPNGLREMVKQFFNPIGDGNCGLCCVSRALGYDTDGHEKAVYLQVREEMIAELTANRSTYTRLQGGEDKIVKIIEGLTMHPTETIVPPQKWLNKPSHGQILANAYSRPIAFFSLSSSHLFLPLRVPPPQSSKVPEPLYLLHVNGNHWVLPHMEGNAGLKPIPPPILAARSTSCAAKGWLAHIKNGVAVYNSATHRAHFTTS